MAAGSHGCRPNWADLPVAARISPSAGIKLLILYKKFSWICHVGVFAVSHAIVRISPMSPIRL